MNNKYKFWIIFSLIIAFAAGFLGGVFGEKYIHQKQSHRGERRSVHFPSLEVMAKELGLSAEQQAEIKGIFERNDAKFKEMRVEIHSHLSRIRAELKDEIMSVLTVEQKEKFQAMIEKYLDERKREYERRSERRGPKDGDDRDQGEKR